MTETPAAAPALGIGQTIREILALFGRNRPTYSLLALLFVGVPAALLDLIAPGGHHSAAIAHKPAFWGALLLYFACALIFQGAAIQAAIEDSRSKQLDFSASVQAGFRHAPSLLPMVLLATLAVLVGLILLVVPGVMLALAWFVSATVVVVEKPGAVAALKRSAELTRGVRWRLLGLLGVFVLAALVAGLVGGILIAALSVLGGAGALVVALIQAFLSLAESLLMTLAVAVVYLRLSGARADVAPHAA